jgi:inner membrane protein
MDTLTHGLLGALLGRVTAWPKRKQNPESLPLRRRMLVGFLAAAFPDIDVISSYISPLSYIYHHRGVTHSLILLPMWAALLAVLFAAIWKGKPRWAAYFGISAVAIGSHIAADWITSFGTMVFAPFSDARYALGTTFIIDLWFTGIILLGLLASLVWHESRRPAAVGLTALAAYVCFQWVLQQQAIDFGKAYARSNALSPLSVSAVPRPVSPFNWTVMVALKDGYRYAHINGIRTSVPAPPGAQTRFIARLNAPYRPLREAIWQSASLGVGDDQAANALAREAYVQPGFDFFRWFAEYPALLRIDARAAGSCVWFRDLRFETPGREPTPFLYGMCRDLPGPWKPFQLMGSSSRPVY